MSKNNAKSMNENRTIKITQIYFHTPPTVPHIFALPNDMDDAQIVKQEKIHALVSIGPSSKKVRKYRNQGTFR